MSIPFRTRGAGGFSLLEILIALGLLALLASGLLALFPVIGRNDRENAAENRAALIASGIMDALAAEGEESLRLASGMSNGLPVWESLPRTPTNRSIAYDESCLPLFPLGGETSSSAVADQRAKAVVTLGLGRNGSLPGMLSAEIAVAEPASAPAERRVIRRFVRLLPETSSVP